MSGGLGRALKVAVGQKAQEKGFEARREAALVERQISILAYLLKGACATREEMARGIPMNRSTLRWHLQAMLDLGLIDTVPLRSVGLYYVKDLLRGRDATVIHSLRSSDYRALLDAVAREPGVTQSGLSAIASPKTLRGRLALLVDLGLLESVREGRNVRYFPTDLGEQTVSGANKDIRRGYGRLVNRLAGLGVRVEVGEDLERDPELVLWAGEIMQRIQLKIEI